MSLYYGKKKLPNATVVGSPTINDGVVSGFSAGNYIALPNAFNPNSNTWEIVIKITTPSSISNSQVFFESTNGANVIRAVSIYIANATKTLSYCLTSNTSSYDIASDVRGSNVLDYSTTYYVKLIFDGTSYKSYISTNGVEWILDFSVTSSTKVFSGAECRLGYFAFNPDLCYQGSIDLNESYIKINGETWWSGIKYTSNKIRDNVSGVYIGAGKTNCLTHIPEDIKLELNSGVLTLKAGSKVYVPNGFDINCSIYGSPTINNGVVSGFSTSNYLSIPKTFDTSQNWEMVFKATVGEDTGNYQCIIGIDLSLFLGVSKTSRVVHFNIGNGSKWATGVNGTEVLEVGKTYLFKMERTGSVIVCSHSIDGKTWVSDGSQTSSYSTNIVQRIGNKGGHTDDQRFSGSIDLSESYIKINGDIFWQGKTGNGKRIFDEVVIETDITLQSGSNWYKGVYLLTYDLTNNAIGQAPLSESISGTVEPSNKSACFWYDTANNLVKEYKSSTLTNAKHSLPIAVTNNPNGSQFTTIDQVFNGMGYIGSTVFALPKVKGLIPDGWEGIHYKNIEFGLDKVVTFTSTATESSVLNIYDGTIGIDIATYTSSNFFKQSNAPNAYQYMLWFDTKENIMKYTEDKGLTWIKVSLFNCADLATSSGKITSFTPKTVKTTNDVVPIGVICKGSQIVYALPNEASIEKATAGTYTFTPVVSGLYEITLVGGGGGGAFNSSSNRSSASSGSSGTACQVRAYLTGNKTYTVTVGAGGARSGWLDANTTGGSGGVSTLKVDGTTLISATGGIGGTVWWPNGSSASGQPAAASVAANNDYFTVESVVFNTRGNSGGTGTHGGGASVYNGYGKGGSSKNAGGSSTASNGGTGYAKIILA